MDLEELLELRGLSRREILQRFRLDDGAVVPGVAYEGLTGVDRVSVADPVRHFFFRGATQVMLYVPRASLSGVDPDALRARWGAPAAELRSRTGSESSMLVWPEWGVAFATDGREVELLELFAPTTLDGYRDRVWRDPGEFIR